MRALLAALWQGDSAFPSGGFAFSNGLEGVAALGGPLDRAGLSAAMETTLRFRWSTTDRVALLHAFAADIRVDPQTFEVFVDGTLATCDPAERLPLAQRYMLR